MSILTDQLLLDLGNCPMQMNAAASRIRQNIYSWIMRDLHISKNAGYAGAGASDPWSNFRQCEQFGIAAVDGVITRMSDKWSRIQSLWKDKSNEQVGESVEDTLLTG
jgi:hypothetical protein